ncbi:hypothetical protein ACE1OE_02985 [Vibrio sp. E150_011]
MKKSILAITLAAISMNVFSADNNEAEQQNYGDPTTIYTMLGGSFSENSAQANVTIGGGQNLFFGDLGIDKDNTVDYRFRYFRLNEAGNAGWSIETLGDDNINTVMAGGVYKFEISDHFSLFPMLYGGAMTSKHAIGSKDGSISSFKDSTVLNGGLYALYAFDEGHWLYANPRAHYVHEARETIPQLEIGGGYMVNDDISVGFRVMSQGETKINDADTSVSAQFSYYF